MSDRSNLHPAIRASDAERERTLTALRAHHAAGRLATDELDERIAATLAATTVAELGEQLRDFPALGRRTSLRRRSARRLPMIVALAAVSTALVLITGAHLFWFWPLLWFAGPWHRRWHHRGHPRSHLGRSTA